MRKHYYFLPINGLITIYLYNDEETQWIVFGAFGRLEQMGQATRRVSETERFTLLFFCCRLASSSKRSKYGYQVQQRKYVKSKNVNNCCKRESVNDAAGIAYRMPARCNALSYGAQMYGCKIETLAAQRHTQWMARMSQIHTGRLCVAVWQATGNDDCYTATRNIMQSQKRNQHFIISVVNRNQANARDVKWKPHLWVWVCVCARVRTRIRVCMHCVWVLTYAYHPYLRGNHKVPSLISSSI